MLGRRRSIFAALAMASFTLALPAAAGPTVEVNVDRPRSGDVVRGRYDMAPLAGLARAGDRPTQFDVMIVLDVSGSTKWPSGTDVDGDGELGVERSATVIGLRDTPNTDPGDSILAAEVAACRALLSGLESDRVRIGIVSFSGEVDPSTGRRLSPRQVDAVLEQPLTGDYAAADRALEILQLRGAHGGTNMEAGIKLALRELAGLPGAQSQPNRYAKQVILLMTDGKPSLPFGKASEEDPEDTEAVIASARLARTAGVTVNVYGLGPGAIHYPIASTEVARVTGGLYTPVRRPGDIVAMLTGVSFANVEDVVAVNLTLAEMSGPDDILLSPDGSFEGFVPVRPGKNRVRISALASDGTRGSTEIEFVFKHQELTDAEMRSELDRIRRRNRELQLLMERERQKAFRESERDRALTIEVEKDEESKP
jgi:hypothetical protein